MNKKIQSVICSYCYADLKENEKHVCPKMPKVVSKPVFCFDTCKLFEFLKKKEVSDKQ